MIDNTHSKVTNMRAGGQLVDLAAASYLQYAALVAITGLAVLLRFYRLGEWSFWIDEVLTVNYSLADMGRFWTPNSFRLIRIALDTYGVSEWSARLAPAILGILTVPLFYFPVRKYFGVWVALLATTILAISPWHLYWSQNARQYAALVLFYTSGFFAFYHWLETDRFRYLVAAGVLMLLAAIERMNAAFFGPVVLIYLTSLKLLPFGRPAGLHWRNMLLLVVPTVALALYLAFGMGMLADYTFAILGRNHNPLRVLLSVIYDIGLPLFLFGLLGGIYLLTQKSRIGLYLLLGSLFPIVLLAMMAPFTQTFSRYVFLTLPGWAILGSVAAKEVLANTTKHARVLALGLVIILLVEPISQNVLYFSFQNGNRENYKDAFALVAQHKQPGDFVVTTRSEIGEYYLNQEVVNSNRIDLDGIIASGERAWFVMDNRTHISDRLLEWIPANTLLIDTFDVYVPGKVMAMRVYLYNPEETW
jgi:mannosyltransferase